MRLDFELRKIPGKGLGLFATKDFKIGEIVESCPIILLNSEERKYAEKTILDFYMYPWRSTRTGSIVLGYGSIINHSFTPNCDWKQNFRAMRMNYKVIQPIKIGEEITVNYNGEPDDKTPIPEEWFNVV